MPSHDSSSSLKSLLDHPSLWRAGEHNLTLNRSQGLPSGHQPLDDHLPWGGWPTNALIEIITDFWGTGELQLVLPLLRNLSQQQWIIWICPPCMPYAPALTSAGINTAHIIVIKPEPSQILWSMEKALQNSACSLVMAWPQRLSGKHIRRLQLTASTGKTLGILFHHRHIRHSSSVLQLHVKPEHNSLRVNILKARGNYRHASFTLEAPTP